ncbi:MAG: ATP-binding protein [Chloroflexi bacterium]|nr:ATP-binding protein [Chloroflexota bacterium]
MAIGKTSSTRIQTNTADEFSFWLAVGQRINPTDIVVTGNPDESQSYGLVTRIENMSDSESHLDNFVSHDFGDAAAVPRTQRLSTDVARCVVLKNTQNIYMPVVSGRDVEFADADGILTALGIGEVQQADPDFRPLPAGVIELSNGVRAPAIIDARYLLGPEGAHFNISGISGLAAKTSYAMFLLNILLQRRDDVAVIVFNVKQDDLLYLDQPAVATTQEGSIDLQQVPEERRHFWKEQQEFWNVLTAKPRPFRNVTRFIPRGQFGRRGAVRVEYNTYGRDLVKPIMYSYNLNDVRDKISYLFTGVEDPRGTLEVLLSDIEEDLEDSCISCGSGKTFRKDLVTNFDDLIACFNRILVDRIQYRQHHFATIGSFLKRLRYFVGSGTSGLFVGTKASNEATLAHYVWTTRPGQVRVIDIAKLQDFERAFVIGDVVNEVYRLFSRDVSYRDVPDELRQQVWRGQELDLDNPIEPPSKLVFFVDELNKYAPAGKEVSPILRNLLEITERGRSLGICLLGAEQFASDIHPRIVGNCSNKVYGRSDSTELGDQAYRHIPQDLKSLITRLDQGKLLLQHPLYRQPVQIRFPRPVYRQPQSRRAQSNESTAQD